VYTIECFFSGAGFIGRNLVDHLIREDLVSEVRVVDKIPPQIAWLSPTHTESFNSPLVNFKSANLLNLGNKLITNYYYHSNYNTQIV